MRSRLRFLSATVLALFIFSGIAWAVDLTVTSQTSNTSKVTETVTVGGRSQSIGPLTYPANTYTFTNGTSTTGTVASVIDDYWVKSSVTLASAGTVTYTLSALTDDFGRTVAFARVREIGIQVTSKTGNDYLTVGQAGTNPWISPFAGTTPAAKVRDLWHIVDNSPAALVVTSSSADQLLITNSGSASMTFTIWIFGNST